MPNLATVNIRLTLNKQNEKDTIHPISSIRKQSSDVCPDSSDTRRTTGKADL